MTGARIQQLQQFIAEDPADPFLHYAMGLEEMKLDHFQDAIAAFQKCIALDETYVAAYYQLGLAFITIDIVDVARSYIEKGMVQALHKDDRKSAAELGELLENLN